MIGRTRTTALRCAGASLAGACLVLGPAAADAQRRVEPSGVRLASSAVPAPLPVPSLRVQSRIQPVTVATADTSRTRRARARRRAIVGGVIGAAAGAVVAFLSTADPEVPDPYGLNGFVAYTTFVPAGAAVGAAVGRFWAPHAGR